MALRRCRTPRTRRAWHDLPHPIIDRRWCLPARDEVDGATRLILGEPCLLEGRPGIERRVWRAPRPRHAADPPAPVVAGEHAERRARAVPRQAGRSRSRKRPAGVTTVTAACCNACPCSSLAHRAAQRMPSPCRNESCGTRLAQQRRARPPALNRDPRARRSAPRCRVSTAAAPKANPSARLQQPAHVLPSLEYRSQNVIRPAEPALAFSNVIAAFRRAKMILAPACSQNVISAPPACTRSAAYPSACAARP